MAGTISPAECTMAHVFEHIQELEYQAYEEVVMDIDIGTLPAPFDMRRTEEGDMKQDYLPVIEQALGIRHFGLPDSAEDAALAEANSLKWYYVAIRTKQDLFTVIKYRSPKPCPKLVLLMAGLRSTYHKHRYEDDFDVFVPCGTIETAEVNGVEPQESEAVAHRLWGLATYRGASMILLTPEEGGRAEDVEFEDAKEPWFRMPQEDLEDLDELWSEFIPTAAELAAERAAPAPVFTEVSRKTADVIMRQAKRRCDADGGMS